MKARLDKLMLERHLVTTRSQAENWIKLGRVRVGGTVVTKTGEFVALDADISLDAPERYVSRAGLKLASVAGKFGVDFSGTTVLDVGSSTGGFTDYALQHGARRVIAVDVGTDQLHPSLRRNTKIELHEKTDIRSFRTEKLIDIVVADVSFVSLRDILPYVATLCQPDTQLLVMVKPQFEAAQRQLTKSGIVKNDRMRREILSEFEQWSKQYFVVRAKADSEVAGAHGNRERFFHLRRAR